MTTHLRKTGISVVGDIPWGAHFCYFYETKQEGQPAGRIGKAVNRVMSGGRYISAALAENLVFDLERETDRPPHEGLSDREFEVLRLIASGRTVSEIAKMLALSDSTISTYRGRILEKMGMKTNAEREDCSSNTGETHPRAFSWRSSLAKRLTIGSAPARSWFRANPICGRKADVTETISGRTRMLHSHRTRDNKEVSTHINEDSRFEIQVSLKDKRP